MSKAKSQHTDEHGFHLRGTAMSRVDGFSDVVFGFALTLLVVSLEVPKTYAELHEILHGFVAFASSFTLFMLLWHSHFRFFRRFGLHDTLTIALNAALLFFVLFFVYLLKFLFSITFAATDAPTVFTSGTDLRNVMALYGLGFACVYLLLACLYANAWRQRDALDLNSLERVLTRHWIADHLGVACIGLLSIAVAYLLPPLQSGYAGLTFLLIAVFQHFYHPFVARRAATARAQLHHLQAIARTQHGP